MLFSKNQKNDIFRQDLLAGFIIFLVALPLCVGIALASGAPPTAGIITAIVGGILGSLLSGSYLTINGPAAGLIAIVLACVEELGRGDAMTGYRKMLACSVLAGSIQLVLGLLQAGSLGLAFPTTVVHAMLAAIGLIITAKQIYVMLGIPSLSSNPLQMFAELPSQFSHLNVGIATIGTVCLFLIMIIAFFGKRNRIVGKLPAPLLVVCIGSFLGFLFDLEHQHTVKGWMGSFTVGPNYLLSVPDSFLSSFYFPDFSEIFSFSHIKHAFAIAFVASTESLLSAAAVDQLDPQRRRSNLNKELTGKGICNIVAALMGGLPMIAEIVRSSANVSNSAKSQLSNFFHGCFLLLFLMTIPQYLHLIPLAALAAVLVFVGYQLGKPSHFKHAFEKGRDQGIVFVVTVIVILATDLLIGVLIGSLLELSILIFRSRSIDVFRLNLSHLKEKKEKTILKVESPLLFTNFLSLKSNIERHGKGSLTLDLRKSRTIDHTVMEHLTHYEKDFRDKGHRLELVFSEYHRSVSAHYQACRYLSKKVANGDPSFTSQANSQHLEN